MPSGFNKKMLDFDSGPSRGKGRLGKAELAAGYKELI